METTIKTKSKPLRSKIQKDELLALANVGPAMREDLRLLGIDSVAQLAMQDPDAMYLRLQQLTGSDQDPCVWDTFAAIVHQARTGEALPWWNWTAVRKQRIATSNFKRRPG